MDDVAFVDVILMRTEQKELGRMTQDFWDVILSCMEIEMETYSERTAHGEDALCASAKCTGIPGDLYL